MKIVFFSDFFEVRTLVKRKPIIIYFFNVYETFFDIILYLVNVTSLLSRDFDFKFTSCSAVIETITYLYMKVAGFGK